MDRAFLVTTIRGNINEIFSMRGDINGVFIWSLL